MAVKQDEDEVNSKPARNKSKGRCHNCQGMGHLANESRKPKKEKPKIDGHEKANVAKKAQRPCSL